MSGNLHKESLALLRVHKSAGVLDEHRSERVGSLKRQASHAASKRALGVPQGWKKRPPAPPRDVQPTDCKRRGDGRLPRLHTLANVMASDATESTCRAS
jgi:hypothetical protein